MTPREQFIAALERRPFIGRVPHFELVFFLTMEAIGKVHPDFRSYRGTRWQQMSEKERNLHRNDVADVFIAVAEKYSHNAIFLRPNPGGDEGYFDLIRRIREKTGDRYFLMMHGDATFSIPEKTGEMEEFAYRMADEPEKLKAEADRLVDEMLSSMEKFAAANAGPGGLDGFALCSDYCTNNGPFMSPNQFSEFVAPYLAKLVKGYRDMGFYVIKHTDGNIMPILDQLVQTEPHALHSLDPQGGVDIGEVKRLAGDKVCLIGNVSCPLLHTGTVEQVVEATRYALRKGMPGGGYILSSSNCIHLGIPLENYETMLWVRDTEGIYGPDA